MLACLAKISPLDVLSGSRVDVRVSSHNDRRVTGLGNAVWEPAMTAAPVLGVTLWNGDFSDSIAVSGATLPINMTVLKETYWFADACMWIGAPVEIYAEPLGTPWPWAVRFVGKVTGFTRKLNVLSLTAEVDTEPFKANVLTKSYAGTGGIEGPAGIKDKVKPLVIGWAKNVEPILIDADNSVYQFSAYGPIEAVSNLFERGSDFGSSVGDYSNYAALVAASVPRGRWATCLASGLIRLGAPAYGVITGDIRGHRVGATTPRLTGAVISALASVAGIGGSALASDTLSRLDAAAPYPVNLVLTEQVKFLDIAQPMALCCNAQAGISPTGLFFAVRVDLEAQEYMTLHAQGRAAPQVTQSEEAHVSVPYWKTTIGANRAWRVHSADEIAFEAPIVPRGLYSAGDTYREGNWVSLADGSEWLYIALSPSSGNAPPDWPTTSNAWWQNRRPPTSASDLKYADGETLEEMKPAQAGADKTSENVSIGIVGQGAGATANSLADLDPTAAAILASASAANARIATIGSVISLMVAAGATVALSGQVSIGAGGGAGNVKALLQASVSGAGSFSTFATGSGDSTGPTEPATDAVSGTFTNGTGISQVFDFRLDILRTPGTAGGSVVTSQSYITT